MAVTRLFRTFGLLVLVTGAAARIDAAGDEGPRPAAPECIPHGEGKDRLCGHALASMSRFQRERMFAPTAGAAAAADTDITHCRLEIEIDPAAQTVTGSNTLDVAAATDGLTQVTLDLRSNMAVDAVTVNGTPAAYTRPIHQVLISLDRPYDRGETFQVRVAYHGTPEDIEWGSFRFDTHGSPPTLIVYSTSQPWGAHTWWPCKEDLSDKFTADIWVTAPEWMVVASNGLLQGTDPLPGGRERHRWREAYPIDVYLVSIAATNYTRATHTYAYPGGAMPVEFYIYPEEWAAIQPKLANVVTMIATFSRPELFGQYPFLDEKYGIAQFNWDGGMEHQTISGQKYLDEWLTAHELAHQWWGDLITCKTWHDIWLNEGFATYGEALWFEKKPGGGPAAYHQHMAVRRPRSYGGTVYCYNISSTGWIFSPDNSYRKAAWVLHMLRHVLGDATFFNTLAAYRAAFEGGCATTDDFRAIAESVSGRDLGWFFSEWVYGPGAPFYRYGWEQEQIGSQNWVRLHVEQYQTAVPPFAMPIDITLTTATGDETHTVWHEESREWYLLPAGGAVTGVALDKDEWILRGDGTAVSYIEGPPKMIRTMPEPGARLDAFEGVTAVRIQFSEPVQCAAADFSVTGGQAGVQSFSWSYSPSNYEFTLAFSEPLAAGQTWTVQVADTLRSQAANAALDGELTRPDSPAALPSGDGVAGGDAVFTFLVTAPGDFDRDADVDLNDLSALTLCVSGPAVAFKVGCGGKDLDRDGDVDQDDFGIFQRWYGRSVGSPIPAGNAMR